MGTTAGRIRKRAHTIARMKEDRLITLAEASGITGYTQRRLRQLAEKKVLPADKYGKTWLVKESVLDQFRETHHPTTGRPRGSTKPTPPHPE